MNYTVKSVETLDWNTIPKAYIESYTWGKEYTPKAYAQLAFVKGEGFALKMLCEEKSPKTTLFNYNDPVCTDSAMEFFASYDNKSKKYLNFEINSAGTFRSAVRIERNDKTSIDKIIDINKISVKTEKTENEWSVEVFFPLDVIKALFGVDSFDSGYTFKGNFYKCGDDTAVPHFGSWSPITLQSPNFHCPEFFGNLIIE